ncbi:glutamate carboxypeptidase like protein [Verticillium longisporum]|nr:glutamate carboxypeptidase like protein [Verticillium longisporum]
MSVIELGWILLDAKSLEEIVRDSALVKPINTPITPLCTSLTTLTWEHVRNAGTFRDAVNRFDAFANEHLTSQNLDFVFVTLDAWDLRVQLPREARDKAVVLPPYLQHSRTFDLRTEYQRWQQHHPESLPFGPSMLSNICAALEVEPILPLDVVNYGVELQAYLDDLVEFAAENDADLDFSELEDAIEVFKKRAGEAKALEEHAVTTNDQNPKDVVNHKYIHFQRGFVSQGGLPNREFYRHVVTAPGLDTGYAAVTFAGATEGIQYAEDGNFDVAQEWVSKIAAGIVVAADILKT